MKDAAQIHFHSLVVARILRIRAQMRVRDTSQTTSSLEQDILQYIQEWEDFKHSLQTEMTLIATSENGDRQWMGKGDGEKWKQANPWNQRSSRWMPKDFSCGESEAT